MFGFTTAYSLWSLIYRKEEIINEYADKVPNLVDKFVEQAGGYSKDNMLLKKLPDLNPTTTAGTSDNTTSRSNKKVRFQGEKEEKSFRKEEPDMDEIEQLKDLEIKMKEYWKQRMDAMEKLEQMGLTMGDMMKLGLLK